MTRSRERDFAQPALGQALAWLRARQYLTQQEVAEGAAIAGEALSNVYYQLVETGKRLPSSEKLDAVLKALSSDRQELAALVAAKVWEGAPQSRYRLSAKNPRPTAYVRAADEALADSDSSGWSSAVEAGTTSFARPPQGQITNSIGRSGKRRKLAHDGAGFVSDSQLRGAESDSDSLGHGGKRRKLAHGGVGFVSGSQLRGAEPRHTTLAGNDLMTFSPEKDEELRLELAATELGIDAGEVPAYEAKLQGQLAELAEHFLRLAPKERSKLLERARKLRRG